MSTTILVGDTHLKQSIILPLVDEALLLTGAERVVFLGDYCDDWNATPAEALFQLGEHRRWVDARRCEGLLVDCLVGNHDMAYLMGTPGPGTMPLAMAQTRLELSELNLKFATEIAGMLATHAGVTVTWWHEFMDVPAGSAADAATSLNDAFQDRSCWYALNTCGAARGGFGTPGPLWADLSELVADPLSGFGQVVGHSPVRTCMNLFEHTSALWACDTFSLTSYLEPSGDGSLLLVEETSGAAPTVRVLQTNYLASLKA